MKKPQHSAEALKLREALDAELASAAAGRELVWSAAENQVIAGVMDAIDRKVDLQQLYDGAFDPRMKVKLSAELRLTENAIGRLLGQVKTDLPQPESLRTVKARAAARVRWDA
jgi:hypothetical protein